MRPPLSRKRDELAISPEMLRWLRVLSMRAHHNNVPGGIGLNDWTALESIGKTLEELIDIAQGPA